MQQGSTPEVSDDGRDDGERDGERLANLARRISERRLGDDEHDDDRAALLGHAGRASG